MGSSDQKGVEIQADFAYIKALSGENLQILVLVECSTNALGFVYMGNREKAFVETSRWVTSLGLVGPSSSVILVRADAEDSLISFLTRVFTRAKVEKAPPQSHETVGAAERGVRHLKEALSCIRHDMQCDQIDLAITKDTVNYIVRYLAVTHNNHKRVFGGNRTPMQLVIGQDRRPLQTAALGSIVHAECPDSIDSPADTRFIHAAYLGPEYGSRASLVCGIIGVPLEPKIFRAKSIKVLNKVLYEMQLCPFLLRRVGSSPSEAVALEVDKDIVAVPAKMPVSGPTKDWLTAHGRTAGCSACRNVKLHGRTHSAECKRRYLQWYDEQFRKDKASRNRDSHSPSPHEVDLTKEPMYHPTGGRRYDDKRPPVPISLPEPDVLEPRPNFPIDLDAHEPQPDVEPMNVEDDYSPEILPPDLSRDDDPMDLDQFYDPGPQLANMISEPPCLQPFPDLKLMPFYLPKVGEPTSFQLFELGGSTVYLAKPISSYAEDGLPLDLTKSLEARMTELTSLNKVDFGKVVPKAEALEFCARWGIKPIGCRWILGPKDIEGKPAVRCRMVVQELAVGPSAASMGVSASTPSAESLRVLLSVASTEKMHLFCLDVSCAYMHSPLPKNIRAVVRLPADVSAHSQTHTPAFFAILS